MEIVFKTVLKLTRIEFDSSENNLSFAIHKMDLGFYENDFTPDGKTAFTKINEAISKEKVQLYLGWDMKVYPQFVLEKHILS